VCCSSQWPAKSICFSHTSAANTLTLLINVSAMVTVYRRHLSTLYFLPGIISLFIMCIGIIRSNSLVGGRARAEVWTPAPERVTLYCTWRPSALTTGLHGQVKGQGHEAHKNCVGLQTERNIAAGCVRKPRGVLPAAVLRRTSHGLTLGFPGITRDRQTAGTVGTEQ